MEQTFLPLPAGHSAPQAEEGAARESYDSDESTWLEDDEELEDSPFRGIWVGIVSAVVTFTLVFIVPYWLGWWTPGPSRSNATREGDAPSVASPLAPNSPLSASTGKMAEAEKNNKLALSPPATKKDGTGTPTGPSARAGTSRADSKAGAPAEPKGTEAKNPAGSSSTGAFWIQVAAFKEAKQATRLSARIRRDGYPAEVRRRESTANPWVVWVGKYANRRQAEEVRAALERKGWPGFLL